MKQVDTTKLQSAMDEHGYNKTRLAGVLRCSVQTVSNIFNRGTIDDADVEVLETIFDKPKGFFNAPGTQQSQQTVANDELYNLLSQFNTNVFSYQMSHDKELKLLNETALTLLSAVKELKKSIEKMEGVSNNNTAKVTTAVAKVRADTDTIKEKLSSILRELKS